MHQKVGRPERTPYKHGFYYSKFKPCSTCPRNKDKTCPYFHQIVGMEHKYKHSYDSFGINRCTIEIDYFDMIKKIFREQFKLTKADEPLLEKMCMIIIRAGRVEEYIAEKGLTQMRMIKDDKTGLVYEAEIQNILKRDSYAEDKMLREWMENLKMSRKSRTEDKEEDDLAIVFTKETKTITKTITKSVRITDKTTKKDAEAADFTQIKEELSENPDEENDEATILIEETSQDVNDEPEGES